MDAIPLWAFFVLACLLVALPLELGYRLGHWRRSAAKEKEDSSVGVTVGSVLGLLAFIMAFTFGMAASRYDDRRNIVLQEANAIGTLYLRVDLLPVSAQAHTKELIREYVDLRILAAKFQPNKPEVLAAVKRSEEIHAELWRPIRQLSSDHPTPITALYVQSLNEVIDLHSSRVQIGARSNIPGPIWAGLFGIAAVALASSGFQAGLASKRRTIVMGGLVLAFAGVLTLVADLDRPQEGTLRTSQAPLLDLQQSMNTGEAK